MYIVFGPCTIWYVVLVEFGSFVRVALMPLSICTNYCCVILYYIRTGIYNDYDSLVLRLGSVSFCSEAFFV